MAKRIYRFIKLLTDYLTVIGMGSMMLLAIIFYFAGVDVKWFICELMPIPVGVLGAGIVCELVRIFMNDHFKIEKGESL